jgi:hypothetical protein
MKKEHSLRDEMRKMENTVRDTSASEFMATPVLDENQWEIDRLVRNKLPAARWNLFAGICLSAFFDPYKKEHLERPKEDRDLIFRSSVLFTVATGQPHCKAVLMVIETGQLKLEAFLDREEAYWLRYTPLLSPSEFSEQVINALEQGEKLQIGQREKVNGSEFRVWRGMKNHGLFELEKDPEMQSLHNKKDLSEGRLRNLTASTNRLLQEVAIHRLMPKWAPSMSPAAEAISQNSSVDILVHSRGKVSRPLLAIEVDGSVHGKNLEKIANDRAKDEVMDAFRIPLIRITESDGDFWHTGRHQPRGGFEKLARFTRLISKVATHISFQVQIEDQLAVEEDATKKLYQKQEEKIANSIFGTAYRNLDTSQKTIVYQSSVSLTELDEYEMLSDEFNFHRAREIEETKLLCKWPDDLAMDSTEPEIVGDPLSGLSARTVLTLPGSAPVKIETPSIRVSGKSLDEEVLSLNLKRCLIEDLVGDVRARLRGSPQAFISSLQ